ncbi:MAG: carboxypeptidase regulatory-like domain-containing protein, partial [Firmicutes bacterium]|nr:carboxypeptidase regulatory-like domain-containing protein [Bacillota bacterium]
MGKNHVRAVMLPRWQETTPFRRPAVGGSAAAARPSAPGWRPLRGLLLAYAVAVWVLVMAQGGAPAVAMAASAPAATVVAATPAAAATSASATGTVYGVVTDDNGHAVPAQVRFVSAEKGLLVTSYTGWLGAYSVDLPPGRYTLEVSRGPEYSVTTRSVQVVAGQKTQADATLSQLYAPGNLGWYGGDTHLHSTYSDGSQAVEDVVRACVANGLAWAALTDH